MTDDIDAETFTFTSERGRPEGHKRPIDATKEQRRHSFWSSRAVAESDYYQ